jgi:hypothetical protein
MRARAENCTGLTSNGNGSMITEPAPLGRIVSLTVSSVSYDTRTGAMAYSLN